TSLVTTAPIPTTAPSLISISCRTAAQPPTHTSEPTLTPPANTAFGLIWAKSPTTQSCSTTEPVLTIQPSPSVAQALITELANTTEPAPTEARSLTTAAVWMIDTHRAPAAARSACQAWHSHISPTSTITTY